MHEKKKPTASAVLRGKKIKSGGAKDGHSGESATIIRRQFVDSFSVKSKLYVVGGSAFEVFDSFSGIFVHHIPYFVIDGNFAFCGQSYFLLVDNKTVMFNVRYVGAIVYDLEKEEWSGYSDFYLVFKPL